MINNSAKWVMLGLVAGAILAWLLFDVWGVYFYDKDLERDFIREVGKTYEQAGFVEAK